MSEQIDKFCEDLRANITMIDNNLRAVKARAEGKADEAERAARQQLEAVQKKIDAAKSAVEAAKPKINKWIDSQKTTAQSKIAEWKAKGDEKSLQLRSDMANSYANAMSVIASSAVDEAAKAALEAWLARYDVEASRLKRSIG